jgi:hypothetical protein
MLPCLEYLLMAESAARLFLTEHATALLHRFLKGVLVLVIPGERE